MNDGIFCAYQSKTKNPHGKQAGMEETNCTSSEVREPVPAEEDLASHIAFECPQCSSTLKLDKQEVSEAVEWDEDCVQIEVVAPMRRSLVELVCDKCNEAPDDEADTIVESALDRFSHRMMARCFGRIFPVLCTACEKEYEVLGEQGWQRKYIANMYNISMQDREWNMDAMNNCCKANRCITNTSAVQLHHESMHAIDEGVNRDGNRFLYIGSTYINIDKIAHHEKLRKSASMEARHRWGNHEASKGAEMIANCF